MKTGLKHPTRQVAEGVANVDNSVAGDGGDGLPFGMKGVEDLQAGSVAEEEGEGAHVCVRDVPGLVGCGVLARVFN